MRTYIIAEAGVNHNGKINLAKKLIDQASKIGADAIKFQSFKSNLLTTLAPIRPITKKILQKKVHSLECLKD